MFENQIKKMMKNLRHKVEYGILKVEFPDGSIINLEGNHEGPKAYLKLDTIDVLTNMIIKGDVGFADDYRKGKWHTDSIAALVSFSLLNTSSLQKYIFGSFTSRVLEKISYFFKRNTKKGSKKNIYAHYDLGNEFYKLWLDSTMTYSSALFKNNDDSLEQAQINKYERILERLGADKTTILEIGCGWGGFLDVCANQNIENRKVSGITISKEQYDYAEKRVEKYKNKAEVIFTDYRDLTGKFDGIVSIEMFEAVGEKYWKNYFAKIKSLLADNGKAIIQTITIADDYFETYKKTTDPIRSFIFPGGMLPSLKKFTEEANAAGLKVANTFAFGKDYAKTLDMWLNTFDEQKEAVKAKGFDDEFIRLWRFYLGGCSGAFSCNRIDVMQIELVHA